MRSRTTSRFRRQLNALPPSVQQQARQAYRQFKADNPHGGLRLKQVHASSIFSVRIARKYRALGKRDDKGMLWFWIGSHADYDLVLKQVANRRPP